MDNFTDPSRRKGEKFCMCKCGFWKHILYYTLYQVGFLICLNWVQLNISMLSKEMSRSLKTRNATKINQIVDQCLAHSENALRWSSPKDTRGRPPSAYASLLRAGNSKVLKASGLKIQTIQFGFGKVYFQIEVLVRNSPSSPHTPFWLP